jgi:predicted AAA+ superfamily ATPase
MFNYLIKGRAFSVHKFYNFLKSLNIKVSKNSVYNYLEYFNDAFIFFPLRRFSWSLKNIEQSIPKIYSVDNGLIEGIVGENKGSKLENLIFLSLLRKGLKPNEEIFYYLSNNEEVDFIIKKGRKITTLIQSCFDLSDYQTKERETKALIRASKELDCTHLLIITSNEEGEELIKDKKIKYIPAWKWLLDTE